MSRWRNPDAQFAPVSPRDFAYARAHLQKARRIVRGTMETKRLEMVGTWFDLSDAMCQIYHTVQGIYAHDHRRRRDINAVFEELQAQNQRIERLQEEIDAHEEWGIGTKETDRSGESNVNKAARSGLLTALMDLRQAAKLDSSTGKSLPDFLKPYALDNMRVSPADHIKVMDRGTYYALERTRNRFEPMEVTSQANRLFANATSENPLVTEGSLAGEFKKHWAYALVDYDEKATGRVLYQITLKSKARDGTLELTLSNPWVAEDEDGLPVGTSLVFERRATTQTRTLVIEPVSIESGRHGSNFLYRLTMLWTPESDSASCESTVEITKIILSDANDDR